MSICVFWRPLNSRYLSATVEAKMSSTQSIESLFKSVKEKAPKSAEYQNDAWYIIVAATLMTADGGKNLGALYKFLIAELGTNDTQESRRRISRRLRAVVMKSWTLVGMPRASDGFFSLVKEEAPEDADQSFGREEYAADPQKANKRTMDWWRQVFGDEIANGIKKSYAMSPDFAWTTETIVYGLFLADLTVLNALENELVILASTMGQGADYTTRFHLKGLRQIGVNAEDATSVQSVIETVAQYLGKDTSSWPRTKEVEHLFP